MKDESLLKKVLLGQIKEELVKGKGLDGGLLMDAPHFDSVEELLRLAEDRVGWRNSVLDLLPEKDPTWKRAKVESDSCD